MAPRLLFTLALFLAALPARASLIGGAVNGCMKFTLSQMAKVVPDSVVENVKEAQRIATQLKETAEYSAQAAKVIGTDASITRWIFPLNEAVQDVNLIIHLARNKEFAQIPEIVGRLLDRGNKLYDSMLETVEKLPPDQAGRRDAYRLVLGDVRALLDQLKKLYDATSGAAVDRTTPAVQHGIRAGGGLVHIPVDALATLVKMLGNEDPARREAYRVVLGDAQALLEQAQALSDAATDAAAAAAPLVEKAYGIAVPAAKSAYDLGVQGFQTGKKVVAAVDTAAGKVNDAVDAVHDKTVGRAKRTVTAGIDWGDEKLENRIRDGYFDAWNGYLESGERGTTTLLARIRELNRTNFGVPRLLAGKLRFPERAGRLASFLEWARTIRASVGGKTSLLAQRSHPVLNHFVDVYLRGTSRAAADFLKSGGDWENLAPFERDRVLAELARIVDAQTDAILSAKPDQVRLFMPEIESLQEFCKRWQELTPIERRIAFAALLDLPGDDSSLLVREPT